jgi:hypothetical protein
LNVVTDDADLLTGQDLVLPAPAAAGATAEARP